MRNLALRLGNNHRSIATTVEVPSGAFRIGSRRPGRLCLLQFSPLLTGSGETTETIMKSEMSCSPTLLWETLCLLLSRILPRAWGSKAECWHPRQCRHPD